MNSYFTYNGHSSSEFNLVIGSMGTATGSISLAMSREILKGTINRYKSNPNHMGTRWNDVLSFTISLIKDPCMYTDQDSMVFTEDEIDAIDSWLTSPDYPLLFHMYDTDDLDTNDNPIYCKYDYFGLFSDITTDEFMGRIIGLHLTFVTNSPFAWTPIRTVTQNVDGEAEFTISVNHAERNREVYPTITITPAIGGGTGDEVISIQNITDNERILTVSLPRIESVINCQNSTIHNDYGLISFEDLNITDTGQIYWPRLYNGENEIKVTGDCSITFQWREARKVGEY